MNRCFLSLGSNLQSPVRQLRQCHANLRSLPQTVILRRGRIDRTPPWGFTRQPDFYNQILIIETRLQPHRLLSLTQQIEAHQGRVRKKRWGPRTLDIDLLTYANRRLNSPKLSLPHPRMTEREFITRPLREDPFLQ